MHRLVLPVTLLALVACKPQSEVKQAPPIVQPPAAEQQRASEFIGDFNVVGTEPFWAMEVRAAGLKLSRAGEDDVLVPNPGPRVEGTKAVWPGQGMVLTLTEGQCSDGMSDRVYPWYAEVTLPNETLKGCAQRPAATLALAN